MTATHADGDTIAAIATAPGRGGIGIVRLSGPLALTIGSSVSHTVLRPRYAHYCTFYDAQQAPLDSGIVLYYAAPNSFTGEDIVELQGHGGPVVLDLLLQSCCLQGARLARAGEFSERAFLHGKIDLAQAEAIADLINSTTEAAARGANRSLQGAFSRELDNLSTQVIELRVYVEAAIDFAEEEIDFIAEGQVREKLLAIIAQLDTVIGTAAQGSLLQQGMKLVIAGKPNAGKSSLLNALSGQDSAIVTATAGTTRDVLREHIQLDGMPLHIVDTAGLREHTEEIEQEGIRRAWQEIESADHILVVVDSTEQTPLTGLQLIPEISNRLPAQIPLTVIYNKCDLSQAPPQVDKAATGISISLSAKTGAGMHLLRQHLQESMGYMGPDASQFTARRRHLQALHKARECLLAGDQQLADNGAGELLAEDLRLCQQWLGEITGTFTSDDLLGEIFSSFCIGK